MTWHPSDRRWASVDEHTPVVLPDWARSRPFPQQLLVLLLRRDVWARLCLGQAKLKVLHRWRASVEAKEEPVLWAQLNEEIAGIEGRQEHWRHLWGLHTDVPYGEYELDVEEWEQALNDPLP